MVGTSRVTDVEGWVLLERNFCLTSLFQNWVILLWHTPKKEGIRLGSFHFERGFGGTCAASNARRAIVFDTFPQLLCNGHVFLPVPWTYPSEN